MRQPIPLTGEMIKQIIRLRKKGIGLRPIGKRLGVSHQTISNWLNSDAVARKYSDVTGFAAGDRAALKREIMLGRHRLRAGEKVVIESLEPAKNVAWISCYSLLSDIEADVPLDALEPSK